LVNEGVDDEIAIHPIGELFPRSDEKVTDVV
jgi:hypothetical protein